MRRILIILLCLLILSSCFDYRGLEDQAIMMGIAVDLEDEVYTLTFEIADIAGAENGQFGAMILSARGETIAQALQDAKQKLHKEMYLGTLRVVLFSREAVESMEFAPFVTHLLHDLQIRNSLPLAVAGEETAGELLTSHEREEQRVIVSNVLGEQLGKQSSTAPAPTIHEIDQVLHTDGGEITLPLVVTSEEEGIFFAFAGSAQLREGRLEKER